MVVVGITLDRKVVTVVEREERIEMFDKAIVVLIKGLVSQELDRRCQAIDDIIVRVYDVVPARHTEKAIAEVKVAVLELVRSPLADLERELEARLAKPEEAPKPELEVKPEPELEVKPEPELEPGKSKA